MQRFRRARVQPRDPVAELFHVQLFSLKVQAIQIGSLEPLTNAAFPLALCPYTGSGCRSMALRMVRGMSFSGN
jgi:hypothetical protein